jgi:hypothetical protein
MNLSAYSENDYSLMKNKLRQIVESFEATEAEDEIEVE